jgi:hypothetical protein
MAQNYSESLDPSLLGDSEASTPTALSITNGGIEEREESPELEGEAERERDESEVRLLPFYALYKQKERVFSPLN